MLNVRTLSRAVRCTPGPLQAGKERLRCPPAHRDRLVTRGVCVPIFRQGVGRPEPPRGHGFTWRGTGAAGRGERSRGLGEAVSAPPRPPGRPVHRARQQREVGRAVAHLHARGRRAGPGRPCAASPAGPLWAAGSRSAGSRPVTRPPWNPSVPPVRVRQRAPPRRRLLRPGLQAVQRDPQRGARRLGLRRTAPGPGRRHQVHPEPLALPGHRLQRAYDRSGGGPARRAERRGRPGRPGCRRPPPAGAAAAPRRPLAGPPRPARSRRVELGRRLVSPAAEEVTEPAAEVREPAAEGGEGTGRGRALGDSHRRRGRVGPCGRTPPDRRATGRSPSGPAAPPGASARRPAPGRTPRMRTGSLAIRVGGDMRYVGADPQALTVSGARPDPVPGRRAAPRPAGPVARRRRSGRPRSAAARYGHCRPGPRSADAARRPRGPR